MALISILRLKTQFENGPSSRSDLIFTKRQYLNCYCILKFSIFLKSKKGLIFPYLSVLTGLVHYAVWKPLDFQSTAHNIGRMWNSKSYVKTTNAIMNISSTVKFCFCSTQNKNKTRSKTEKGYGKMDLIKIISCRQRVLTHQIEV